MLYWTGDHPWKDLALQYAVSTDKKLHILSPFVFPGVSVRLLHEWTSKRLVPVALSIVSSHSPFFFFVLCLAAIFFFVLLLNPTVQIDRKKAKRETRRKVRSYANEWTIDPPHGLSSKVQKSPFCLLFVPVFVLLLSFGVLVSSFRLCLLFC